MFSDSEPCIITFVNKYDVGWLLELAYSVQTVATMTAEVSRGSPAKRRHGQSREIILIGFHKHHLAVAGSSREKNKRLR